MIVGLSSQTLPRAEVVLSTTSALVSRLIRWETRGDYSHAAIVLRPSPPAAAPLLWESVATTNPETGISGLRCLQCHDCRYGLVVPYDDVTSMTRIPLDMSQLETDAAHRYLSSMLGVVRYAPLQLAANLISCITGCIVARLRPCRYRWTCSETVARALPPRIARLRLNIGYYRYDDIAPSGSRLPSLDLLRT